ncbi:hypothetical protein QQF64_020580 [Cirrhinus molitorella]|uniref:Uncharacterized protein n=1 Tax=Cirrhinus molitorella TaxID=172907 RepID=A0ABR3L9J6_9TELE
MLNKIINSCHWREIQEREREREKSAPGASSQRRPQTEESWPAREFSKKKLLEVLEKSSCCWRALNLEQNLISYLHLHGCSSSSDGTCEDQSGLEKMKTFTSHLLLSFPQV